MKIIKILLLSLVFLFNTGFNLQTPNNGVGDDPNSNIHLYSKDLNIASTLYTMWDLNHNRILDETEWEKSLDMYADSEVAKVLNFSNLDRDEDNLLDINEFRDGLSVLNNQHLRTILKEDPAKLAKANRLEIWDTDDDDMVEKIVAGSMKITYDNDNN